MSTNYDWYFAALKQPAEIGKSLPVHENEPQPGFYRKRRGKSGGWYPVAIWHDGEKLTAALGENIQDPFALWTWVCRQPVTEEAYRNAVKGEPWPDEAPGIGHNQGPASDFETIAEQIESASACVSEFAEISDDEKQAQAQSARARLNELSRDADKKRTEEKAPHLEAGKAVDAKWQPLVKSAKAAADTIAKAMSAFETAKARKQAEERRRQEEEARKAEEARRAAEPDGEPSEQAEIIQATPEPEPVKTVVKGGYGRAATVKVIKVATVVDQDAAYQAMRTHPELVRLIAQLAQRAVDAGHEIAGVTFEEERKVA